MNPIAAICGVMSGVMQLAGYITYIVGMAKFGVRPNFTSWGLWVFGAAVSILVYQSETSDAWKLVLPITCAVCSVVVALYALLQRSFDIPDKLDVFIALCDIAVIGLWIAFKNSHLAYYFLILDTTISFLPIVRSTLANPQAEIKEAWAIWTLAYVTLVLVCLTNWEGILPMLLPSAYLCLHFCIFLIVRKKQTQ